MNWNGKRHPLEMLVEWAAPAMLAAAAGWAARAAAMPIAGIIAVAMVAFAVGMAAMRAAGTRSAEVAANFEPVALEPANPDAELGELLLRPEDEVLILDDPLVEVALDSRVVRLFDRQDATPGELVDRIADFLGDSRREGPNVAPPENAVPVDASAALHAALANIRASLR